MSERERAEAILRQMHARMDVDERHVALLTNELAYAYQLGFEAGATRAIAEVMAHARVETAR